MLKVTSAYPYIVFLFIMSVGLQLVWACCKFLTPLTGEVYTFIMIIDNICACIYRVVVGSTAVLGQISALLKTRSGRIYLLAGSIFKCFFLFFYELMVSSSASVTDVIE